MHRVSSNLEPYRMIMKKQEARAGVLVVMELGSEWPAWLSQCCHGVSTRRVTVQEETETLARFCERVAERIDTILAEGAALDLAVLACNERADARATSARQNVVETMASALGCRGGGRVVLTASERSNGRVRRALCSFADDISQRWSNTRIVSSVSFGAELDGPSDSDVPLSQLPVLRVA
jgi:hypothetical protein